VIGGNVSQTVMMRKLPLNADKRFSPSAQPRGECRMNQERGCSLNGKHWVGLLKLQD